MRGYVEICPNGDQGPGFIVMDWSESGDSGWCAGTFQTREAAVRFATRYAAASNRFLHHAEIIPFKARVAA